MQLGKTLKSVEQARIPGENDRMIDMTIEKIVDGKMEPAAPPSINKLAWLGGKVYIQSMGGRKNRPGESVLHAEAVVEDASRTR